MSVSTKTSVKKMSSSSVRSPSPTRLSRLQEKQELGGLNDRLANYIDKVRNLESENNKLNIQIRTYEETSSREVNNVKSLFERELADARKLLDDTAKAKAMLQIEANKYKTSAENYMLKYNKRERDIAALEAKLLATETEMNEFKGKYADVDSQRIHWESEYKRLKADLAIAEKQLSTAQKQLEEETLARVDLENRVQTLKEELALRSQIHEQQLNETRSRSELILEEVDTTVEREYQTRLADGLREMRQQHELDARMYREEIEQLFESKLIEMRLLADKKASAASTYQEELKVSRRKLDEITQQITKLSAENAMLLKRVSELEDQLLHEQDDHARSMEMARTEIREIRLSMESQMREYSDLMDIKIGLDMEIAAYRKLLEVEEERLNLSSSSEASFRSQRTPCRSTPTRSGKRKRVTVCDETDSARTTEDYMIQLVAKETVALCPINLDLKYIELNNTSEKDAALGGYQLRHVADSEETTFKFHRSTILKAGQTMKVWSSETETVHNPPSDLVMKGQKWTLSDQMRTVLLNSKGEEVAECSMTMTRKRITYTSHRTSGGSDLTEGSAALGRLGGHSQHRVFPPHDTFNKEKPCYIM